MSTAAPETISDELNIPVSEPEEAKDERRGRGRPEGSKNKGPDATFFDRLKNLDWERHVVYLYRLQPLIDLTTAGGSKYVTKYAEPFDEDRVMRDLGSGMYQARLTELQGTTGKSKQIDTYNFEVFNMKYPPQIPVGVWLEDHRNERWKWAKGLLTSEQNKPEEQRNGSGQDTGRLVQTIAKELREGQLNPGEQFKAHAEIYKMGLADAKAPAPAAPGDDSALKLLIPVITAALTAKEKPADDPVLGMMKLQLELQREQNKADREQAKADREAAEKRAEAAEKRHSELMNTMLSRKETSGLESVQQFAQIFAAVKGIGEGGLVAPTDNSLAGVFMDGLRDALPDVLRSVAPGVGQMLGGIGRGATPPRAALPPGAPPQSAPPAPAAGAPPAPPPQADPHIGAYQCVFMNQAALLNAVKAGKPGVEFGDWLVEGHGPLEIEKLKAAGVDRIVAFISQQIPALWTELQPFEMKFRSFLSELMSWTPADEDDPDEPPAEPSAATEPVFPGGKKTAKAAKKGAN